MLAFNRASSASMRAAASALARTCEIEPSWVQGFAEVELAGQRYAAGDLIGPPQDPPPLVWILDGWACEARELTHERRQIFSFALPGEVVRPPSPGSGRTLRALTVVECVPASELLARIAGDQDLVGAVSRSADLADARRYEHLVRLAGRSATARMASLLIELHDRLEAAGLAENGAFALPLRHEEFADALGLSAAHVTRCLGVLRDQSLLNLQFRRVTGFDRAGLETVCAA
jgi:CRP-like cAMP-binding protein